MKNFLNPEGHQNCISGSKETVILLKGQILVKLHREGSAPAACAGGFFWSFCMYGDLLVMPVLNKTAIEPFHKHVQT